MKGQKREQQDFNPKVGWAECKVIAINPDKEELEKLGYSPEEEPVYADTDKKVDNQRIDVYLEEISSGYRFRKSFWLENENNVTEPEEGSDKTKKTQYVNQVAQNFYAETEDDLPENFTNFLKYKKKGEEPEIGAKKTYRIAKKGEALLLDFIRKWLTFNYNDAGTSILLDMKKIFNGNFKELKEQVGGEMAIIERNGKEYPSTVVEMLQVKTKDTDNGPKSFQTTWKTTLPGYMMKSIRNTKFSPENVEKWRRDWIKAKNKEKDGRWPKDWEKLAVEISTGEHKSKDHFSFDLIRDYTGESENFVASGKSITGEKRAITEDQDDY